MGKYIGICLTFLMLFIPTLLHAGGKGGFTPVITTDSGVSQLVSYYDLRNRESYVQISNIDTGPANIHVQIFRNDFPNCQEINFYDTLTGNDTHIYNLRNLVGNAIPVNAQLSDTSNGIVVITLVNGTTNGSLSLDDNILIGNFRIVDESGYEYRTNSAGIYDTNNSQFERGSVRYTLNFNQIGGNNLSDVIGVELRNLGEGFPSVSIAFDENDLDTAEGFVFVYNDAENATSCDNFDFSCGGESNGVGDFLNVGINDVFPSSNGDQLLCAGNQDTSGFVEILSEDTNFDFNENEEAVVGFIGLNNGNGTGSMDSWIANNQDICDFLEIELDSFDCENIEM